MGVARTKPVRTSQPGMTSKQDDYRIKDDQEGGIHEQNTPWMYLHVWWSMPDFCLIL